MKRKVLWSVLGLVGLGAIASFGFGPGYLESSVNKIDGEPLIEVSDKARALHATLTIADLHSDTLAWDRNLNDRASRGHMDLPRLKDGNVALQVFSSVTKTPRGQNYDANGADTDNITAVVIVQLQPIRTWNSLLERSLFHVRKLDQAAEQSAGAMVRITDAGGIDSLVDARAKPGNKPVGTLFSAEGLQSLEGDIANLEKLYAAGMRMAGITHFFDNELAGSMHGLEKGGLTDMGRKTIRKMEDMGMVVDIAHCSHTCVADILAMARRPVVSSHGGVWATCKVNRNLTDEEIRGVAATGGVIGVGYWEGAVCSTDPRATARAMKHIRDLVGIEYVALGSDYDGATTVRFDTSQLVQVTQALIDEGFSEADIRAAMGENTLRVLRAGLLPMAELTAGKPAA